MAWTIFELLINLFQAGLMMHFIRSCQEIKPHSPFFDVLFFSSIFVFFSSFLFFDLPPIDIIVFAIPLVYSLLFSLSSFLNIIYFISLLILIFNIVVGLSSHIFSLIPLEPILFFTKTQTPKFLFMLVSNLLLFLFLQLIIRLHTFSYSPKPSTRCILLAMLSSVLLTEEVLYALETQRVINHSIFVVGYLGLALCAFFAILLCQIIIAQAKRQSYYEYELSLLKLSQQHQHELSQTYQELTIMRHDFKQHVAALHTLVQSVQLSEAEHYLSTLDRTLNSSPISFGSGSLILDALLASKQFSMESKNIIFSTSLSPLNEFPLPLTEFCSIIGNLLDNAIEGVSRIPAPSSPPTITLNISRRWNMLYIVIENPCSTASLIRSSDSFLSSKTNYRKAKQPSSGIGLFSISKIVEQHEGRCEFSSTNGIFTAKIVLPYLDQGEYT